MTTSLTVSNTLTPRFRYIVFLLWIVVCTALGWVSLSERDLFARLLFGVPSLLGCALLIFFVQEESRLATHHLLSMAEVVGCTRLGCRGRSIEVKYRFVAVDSRTYEKTSSVSGRRELKPTDAIPILCNPLMPASSKPVDSFIFYRFPFPRS